MATLSAPLNVISALKVEPQDKIIFIQEDSFADSNFIITHFFKQLLAEKSRICFLSLHNHFDHYLMVGKKLGYNLTKALESGNVQTIDLLEHLVENSIDSNLLSSILLKIQNQIDTFIAINPDEKIYLIVDDLSHFFDIGISLSDLLEFTNDCVNLTATDNVYTIINSYVSLKDSDLIAATSLQYVCDLFVAVTALKTGRSADVTGTMMVRRGQNANHYHFKTFDRGVKVFHRGEAVPLSN